MKNIKEVAALTGVTERTLRYYESVGLLNPKRNAINGYREYTSEDLDRLYQILVYRSLDLPIKKIQDIFFKTDITSQDVFKEQYEQLLVKRDSLNRVIENLEEKLKGKKDMEKEFKYVQELIDENEKEFGKEIRAKYGDDIVNASNEYLLKGGDEKQEQAQILSMEIDELLKLLVKENIVLDDEKSLELFEKHKAWLQVYYPHYSKEYHRNLADMYEYDERFASYYENIIAGGMKKIVEVIRFYTK